ncbi:hypothetical protein PspLS_00631 [Pyricularia sp. CBS 133598]|nr:hypothetical protein PspLS_00631 [Pyricularia sp. CBS 133598]
MDAGDSRTQMPTRKAHLERMAKHVEELKKQNPDWDLEAEKQWWVPGTNLIYDLRETLDKETYDKYDACFARVIQQNYAPAARADAQEEVKTILAEHPDLLDRVNATYFPANADEIYQQIEAARSRTAADACQLSK